MRRLWAMGAAGLLGSCIPAGDFVCEQNGQCSGQAEGVCQPDGRCSYPDAGCDSGQRYSDLAGDVAGACVPPTGNPTTSPDADSCDEVDCGPGTCVMIDDAPTCACDPGWYAVGLQCAEDPCEVAACRFVDAEQGDDQADGSRETPWRTIARLETALAEAAPGDHFLLRRGQQWAENRLDLVEVAGSADAPIVVGAYGPPDDPRPHLVPMAVQVLGSEHVVLRDLWIGDADASQRPCVMVEDSRYVVVQDNLAEDCHRRGIRAHNGAAYTTIVGNEVRDVINYAAILVGDAYWDEGAQLGSHHWIVDNVITGAPEEGIRLHDYQKSDTDTFPTTSITDIKVVGNRIADVGREGVWASIDGWVWAVGNVVARADDPAQGTAGGLNMIASGPVRGNVVLRSRRGLELRGTGPVSHNTIVHEGEEAALLVPDAAEAREIDHNLVLVRGDALWVRLLGGGPTESVAAMDLNWYATDGEPCRFEVMTMALELPAFTEATGFDANSACAPVPGFGAVPTGLLPAAWDDAFWQTLAPDPDWARCDDPAGARDCDGEPLGVQIEAIEGYDENEGLGWAGPLVVRQRYPLGE